MKVRIAASLTAQTEIIKYRVIKRFFFKVVISKIIERILVVKTGICFLFISLCKIQLYMHTNNIFVVKEQAYSYRKSGHWVTRWSETYVFPLQFYECDT